MSTLRIIHDNAVDRATSIVASTTASLSTAAENMRNDFKSKLHRSTGTSVTYTLQWASPQTIAGAGFPAINLTPDATIRLRLYNTSNTLIADTGAVTAVPGMPLGLWDWTGPLNGNAFAYGGTPICVIWFDTHYAGTSLVIDVVDPTNPAGYIDCARIVAGGYWATSYNPDYGAEAGIEDMTDNSRSDSGDFVSDRGPMYDRQSIQLNFMPEQDRARMMQIMRSNGSGRNLLLSTLTGNASTLAEQDWIIYGKKANNALSFSHFERHSTTLTVEGW